jgi:hypothetical protein
MNTGKETRSRDGENYSRKIPEEYFAPTTRETHHKIDAGEIPPTEDIVKVSGQFAGLRVFNAAKVCYDWGETSLLKR